MRVAIICFTVLLLAIILGTVYENTHKIKHDYSLDVDMNTVYMYDGTTNEELGKTSIDSIGTWIINDSQ